MSIRFGNSGHLFQALNREKIEERPGIRGEAGSLDNRPYFAVRHK